MDLEQVSIFLVLAEELHFGKAAERLNMSQPTLTRHLQGLERTFGVKLVNRGPRRVTLTASGELLAREGPTLVQRFEVLKRALREAGEARA
jgi:DNA-binding transcriptional LysR family regulator